MHADPSFRFLRFLLVGTLRLHLFAIGVNGILTRPVSFDYWCDEQFVESRGERFSTGRIADNLHCTIQSSQILRTMIEAIRTACHQRHHKPASHKQGCYVLILLQPLTYVLKYWELWHQRLYLLTPIPEPLVNLALSRRLRLLWHQRAKHFLHRLRQAFRSLFAGRVHDTFHFYFVQSQAWNNLQNQ